MVYILWYVSGFVGCWLVRRISYWTYHRTPAWPSPATITLWLFLALFGPLTLLITIEMLLSNIISRWEWFWRSLR